MKLYVDHTSHPMETSDVDPDDEWNRADTQTDHYFEGVSITPKFLYDDWIEVDFEVKPGDIVHVVYAIWSTGDSFGHDENGGFETILAFKTLEKAKACVEALRETNKEDEFKAVIYSESGKKLDVFKPWVGFFETLTELTIKTFVVQGE